MILSSRQKTGVVSARAHPAVSNLQPHSAFINSTAGSKLASPVETEVHHQCQTHSNPAGESWKPPRLATAHTSWTTVTDGSALFADRKKRHFITGHFKKKINLFLDCQLLVVQSLMSFYERLAWTQYLQQRWKYFDSDQIQSAGNPKPTGELKTKTNIFIYLFIYLFCYASLKKIHRWRQLRQLSDYKHHDNCSIIWGYKQSPPHPFYLYKCIAFHCVQSRICFVFMAELEKQNKTKNGKHFWK